MKKLMVVMALVMFVVGSVLAQDAPANRAAKSKDPVEFVVGIGFIISPEYNDFINDVYSDVTGGYGWLDVQVGVRFNTPIRISITPSINMLVNGVTGDESYANFIFLPTLAARYSFLRGHSPYVEGHVDYGFPTTGSESYDINKGGVGFGGAAGFAFKFGFEVELGYSYIPVEVESTHGSSHGTTTKNFGGPLIQFRGAF